MAIRENVENQMHHIQERKLVLLGEKVPLSINPMIRPESYAGSVNFKGFTMNK